MLLGEACYRKVLGDEVSAPPLHWAHHVRRLTERECSLLAENPAQLMAEFDAGDASAFGTLSARPTHRQVTPRARIPRLPIWTIRQFGAQAEKEVEAKYGRSPDLKGWRSLVDLRIRELAAGVTASKT